MKTNKKNSNKKKHNQKIIKSKMLIPKNDQSEKDKLEEIIQDNISQRGIKCKRFEVAKSAALTLLGPGALHGTEYLLARRDAAKD